MSGGRKRNMARLALLVSCCLLLYWLAVSDLMPACPSRYLVGMPCPGCGGGRSALALLHGDLSGALWYNPLSVLLIAFLLVSGFWLAVDIVRGRESYARIYRAEWSRAGVAAVLVVLAANWVWNIFKYM